MTTPEAERLAAEIERGPLWPQYPAPAPLGFAIEVALERIEEWDHGTDPHGWCHDRPVLIALVAAALGVSESAVTNREENT